MLSRQELIDQGWLGDFTVDRGKGPTWAKNIGWDGVGCWLVTPREEVMKAIPGLQIHARINGVCSLKIADAPPRLMEYESFFTRLEKMGVDNLAVGAFGFLKCDSGILNVGIRGESYISGPMQLIVDTGLNVITSTVYGRFILAEAPAEVRMVRDATVLPPFKVPCNVCLSAAELNETAEDDYPELDHEREPDVVFLSRKGSSSSTQLIRASTTSLFSKLMPRSSSTKTTLKRSTSTKPNKT